MKITTYNINGLHAHLAVLLRWLAEARPDVVCLQELKAPQDTIFSAGTCKCRLQCHLARAEDVEWCRYSFKM